MQARMVIETEVSVQGARGNDDDPNQNANDPVDVVRDCHARNARQCRELYLEGFRDWIGGRAGCLG